MAENVLLLAREGGPPSTPFDWLRTGFDSAQDRPSTSSGSGQASTPRRSSGQAFDKLRLRTGFVRIAPPLRVRVFAHLFLMVRLLKVVRLGFVAVLLWSQREEIHCRLSDHE